MNKNKRIEMNVADTITEKPIGFSVGDRKFSVHPPTLGKMQILSKYYLMLEIDEKALDEQPHLEAMRVCEAKTDIVCGLMAVAVLKTKEELLDDEKINELTDFFKWNTGPADFSNVLLAVLTQVDYANFITSIRLTGILRQNEPRG